jgi:hypothetical protein
VDVSQTGEDFMEERELEGDERGNNEGEASYSM